MLDDLFQAGTDAALDDYVRRAKPEPKPDGPAFSAAGMVRGGGKGLLAGIAESIGSAADVVGAFGQVAGAYPEALGVLPTAKQRDEANAQRKKLLEQGVDFTSPAGDVMRARGAELLPDPTTTHVAEQMTAGVTRFLGKAVGHAATFGPAAPGTLAVDEGLTEADKLRLQGVDLATRTKAGAVAGGIAGASIAVPVVGRTALETVGLVAAAGPGGFVAQNAATQTILRHADYAAIASHYDPFDPVGLALSTLVPAGFGAVAHGARARAKPASTLAEVVLSNESGGQRYGADGKLLTSPKGAQGEMQVMPATARDPGYGVTPARDDSPEELARVGRDFLTAMRARYGDDAKAMAAYNGGPGRLDAAVAAHGDAWLAHMPAETRAYVANGLRKLGDQQVADAVRAQPEVVEAARAQHAAETLDAARLAPDGDIPARNAHADAVAVAHDQIVRGEPVEVADILAPHALDPARVEALRARMPETLAEDVRGGAAAARAPLDETARGAQPESAGAPAARGTDAVNPSPATRDVSIQQAASAPEGQPATPKPDPATLHREAAIAQLDPALTIHDATGARVSVRDHLEAVKAEAADDAKEASLIQAAVACLVQHA